MESACELTLLIVSQAASRLTSVRGLVIFLLVNGAGRTSSAGE
jgi:hypothetical protein